MINKSTNPGVFKPVTEGAATSRRPDWSSTREVVYLLPSADASHRVDRAICIHLDAQDEEKCVRFSARIRSIYLESITFMILGRPDLRHRDLKQVHQERDQWFVGGRHRIVAQRFGPHPFDGLAFAAFGETLVAAADVERHQQVKFVIAVARECERREARDLGADPELLFEFADQRLFGCLATLDFTARELPEAGERLALRALRQQNTSVGIDERASGDEHDVPTLHVPQTFGIR
ncbi:conserved hypothetical protein [Sinorhizobium medicae]|uniref:Uncharacterized protein n=1 Tax=Sinorhizobium medicae TaxID=110321 RepID=A0A508WW46_9HYPH|nr:conserved hypothetical protein [Sinorhizobium medicae]